VVLKEGMPSQGELVLCKVVRITPYAAWVKIEEYPQVEGMIHVSEVAGKWVHDIREFVKVGKQYVGKVMRTDPQKNFVNLSIKRVTKYDEKQKLNSFRRDMRAERILEKAAKKIGKNLQQAYDEVGFLLVKKYGDLFSGLEEAKKSDQILKEAGIPGNWAKAIFEEVQKNLKDKEIMIRMDLELKSYAPNGLEIIKHLIKEIEKSTNSKIKYISAPVYRLELKTTDPKSGEKKIRDSLSTFLDPKKYEIEATFKMLK